MGRVAANETTLGIDTSRPRGRSGDPASKPITPLAIVGLSAHFGPFDGKESFENRVLGYEHEPTASQAAELVGDCRVALCRDARDGTAAAFPGYYIDSLEFGVDQFRIPPKELAEMQPQQSLMLRVAAEAIGDARWDARQALRTGVLIGIGLDLNTTNYSSPLVAGRPRQGVERALGLALAHDELARWIDDLTPLGRAGSDGQPDDGVARRTDRQPDRSRVQDRRTELHGLLR